MPTHDPYDCPRVRFRLSIIQNVISADDIGIDIRKERKRNVLLLAKFRQAFLIVVGDRIDLHAGGFELIV